jgi:hypothetical protein
MKTNKKKLKFQTWPVEKAESLPEMNEMDHVRFFWFNEESWVSKTMI